MFSAHAHDEPSNIGNGHQLQTCTLWLIGADAACKVYALQSSSSLHIITSSVAIYIFGGYEVIVV